MLKKCLVLIFIGVMCNSVINAGLGGRSNEPLNTGDSAAEAKKKIAKIGIGKKAKVTIKLLDDKKIKGYVSKIDDASFTVTNENSGADTEISYVDVKSIVRRGIGFASGILIGALATAAVLVTVLFVVSGSSEPR